MITGGKETSDINGLQFFTAEGPVDEDTIAKMLDKAYKFAFIGEWFECEPVNVMQMYAAEQRRAISEGLSGYGGNLPGMHIIVESNGGTAEYFAPEVLEKLGADISDDCDGADIRIKFDMAMETYEAYGADGNLLDSSLDIEELIIEETKRKNG